MSTNLDPLAAFNEILARISAFQSKRDAAALGVQESVKQVNESLAKTPDTPDVIEMVENFFAYFENLDSDEERATFALKFSALADYFNDRRIQIVRELAADRRAEASPVALNWDQYDSDYVDANALRTVLVNIVKMENVPTVPKVRRIRDDVGKSRKGTKNGDVTVKRMTYVFDGKPSESHRLRTALFANTRNWGGSGIGGRLTEDDVTKLQEQNGISADAQSWTVNLGEHTLEYREV